MQPQTTGPVVGEVLHLYRDAVGVFYSPGRLGQSLGKSYPSAAMQSVYSTRWNDKIVVLKKTTLQLYFKTFIEKKSIQVT